MFRDLFFKIGVYSYNAITRFMIWKNNNGCYNKTINHFTRYLVHCFNLDWETYFFLIPFDAQIHLEIKAMTMYIDHKYIKIKINYMNNYSSHKNYVICKHSKMRSNLKW